MERSLEAQVSIALHEMVDGEPLHTAMFEQVAAGVARRRNRRTRVALSAVALCLATAGPAIWLTYGQGGGAADAAGGRPASLQCPSAPPALSLQPAPTAGPDVLARDGAIAAEICRYAGFDEGRRTGSLVKAASLDTATSARLAALLHAAKRAPQGGVARCPADTGARAAVLLRYQSHADSEVLIQLSGCGWAAGPNSASRYRLDGETVSLIAQEVGTPAQS